MTKRHIRKFVGELTKSNFDRVSDVIFEDDVVALDVMIASDLFDDMRLFPPLILQSPNLRPCLGLQLILAHRLVA